MNFQALKWMIKSLTTNFNCSECKSTVTEEHVEIVWAAWNTINLDIGCSKCGKHTMIKSEVLSVDLKWKLTKEQIKGLKWKLNIKRNTGVQIKDEQIVELNKNLKKEELNVSDLLWSE